MAISLPTWRTTSTASIEGHCPSAASTLAFSGTSLPPRIPASAVITIELSQSWMRPARASGLNPPNTTEWIAPIREQASMATAASGTIGM